MLTVTDPELPGDTEEVGLRLIVNAGTERPKMTFCVGRLEATVSHEPASFTLYCQPAEGTETVPP
jgi:hypothetical protein